MNPKPPQFAICNLRERNILRKESADVSRARLSSGTGVLELLRENMLFQSDLNTIKFNWVKFVGNECHIRSSGVHKWKKTYDFS